MWIPLAFFSVSTARTLFFFLLVHASALPVRMFALHTYVRPCVIRTYVRTSIVITTVTTVITTVTRVCRNYDRYVTPVPAV